MLPARCTLHNLLQWPPLLGLATWPGNYALLKSNLITCSVSLLKGQLAPPQSLPCPYLGFPFNRIVLSYSYNKYLLTAYSLSLQNKKTNYSHHPGAMSKSQCPVIPEWSQMLRALHLDSLPFFFFFGHTTHSLQVLIFLNLGELKHGGENTQNSNLYQWNLGSILLSFYVSTY